MRKELVELRELICSSPSPSQLTEDILNPLMATHLALSTLLYIEEDVAEAWQVLTALPHLGGRFPLTVAKVLGELLQPFLEQVTQLEASKDWGLLAQLTPRFTRFVQDLRDFLYQSLAILTAA